MKINFKSLYVTISATAMTAAQEVAAGDQTLDLASDPKTDVLTTWPSCSPYILSQSCLIYLSQGVDLSVFFFIAAPSWQQIN